MRGCLATSVVSERMISGRWRPVATHREPILADGGAELLKHLGAVGVTHALTEIVKKIPEQITDSGALPTTVSALAGLVGGPLAWGVVLIGGCLLQCRKSRCDANESRELFRKLYRKLCEIEQAARNGNEMRGLLDELLGQNLVLKKRLACGESDARAFAWAAEETARELGLDKEPELKLDIACLRKEALSLFQTLVDLIGGIKADLAEMKSTQSASRENLQTLLERTNFYPPIRIPVSDPQQNRFRYSAKRVPLYGREEDLTILDGFVRDERRVLWWLLTGPGGMGKSRLGLELCLQAESRGWYAGFLSLGFSDWGVFDRWIVDRPTLLVIDYVRERAAEVGKAVALMHSRSSHFDDPVRFLLIERPTQETDDWLDKFYHRRSSELSGDIAESNYRRGFSPHVLAPLNDDALKSIFRFVLGDTPGTIINPTDLDNAAARLSNLYVRIDPLRRPLLAAFAAETTSRLGVETIREWNVNDLVTTVLKREASAWDEHAVDGQHINLLVLATILRGLSKAQLKEAREATSDTLLPDPLEVNDTWNRELSSFSGSASRDFAPLEPDPLGECLVLSRLGGDIQTGYRNKHRLQNDTMSLLWAAWRVRQSSAAAFILRTVNDFSGHAAMPRLFELPGNSTLEQRALLAAIIADSVPIFLRGNHAHFADQLVDRVRTWMSLRQSDVLAAALATALNNYGITLEKMGDAKGAIAKYDAVLVIPYAPAKQRAEALFNRGVAYGILRQFEREIETYSRLAAMPDVPAKQRAMALVNRGFRRQSQGKYTDAIEDYALVMQMPDAPSQQKAMALLNRGVVYDLLLAQAPRAIQDYTAVLTMPDAPADQKAPALLNRGALRAKLHQWRRAIEDFTGVLTMVEALPRDRLNALLNRARALSRLQEYECAIDDLSMALGMPEISVAGRADAHYWRGIAYQELGGLNVAMDLGPSRGEPGAQREALDELLEVVNSVVTNTQQGELRSALADYTAALAIPEAPSWQKASTWLRRGVVYGLLDQFESAIKDFSAVLVAEGAMAAQRAEALVNRGMAYYFSGDNHRAIDDYDKALAMPELPVEVRPKALSSRALAIRKLDKA